LLSALPLLTSGNESALNLSRRVLRNVRLMAERFIARSMRRSDDAWRVSSQAASLGHRIPSPMEFEEEAHAG
jgi:hypothetical protein